MDIEIRGWLTCLVLFAATSAHKARQSAVKSSLLRKAELELGLAGKARPLTSGSELSDDEDQEELNNLAPGDLKRVKRYFVNQTPFGIRCILWVLFCKTLSELVNLQSFRNSSI